MTDLRNDDLYIHFNNRGLVTIPLTDCSASSKLTASRQVANWVRPGLTNDAYIRSGWAEVKSADVDAEVQSIKALM